MKILRVRLENFKGFRDKTFEFGDRTLCKGKNGIGKSSILSGIFWVMADRDVDLTANPNVRPNGAIDETTTTVTIDMTFGERPAQIQKSQKMKRSKSGTVSLTNSYMINSVPKSEKAFKEYMTELGVDFDKFLACTHPGVLLAGINNKKERTALRNMLFEMASDITDLDVCKDDPELAVIAELLGNYKAEEIEAIQNNTLRKIRENYGKEGEILRAKIEGLEVAKVEVDVDAHQKAIQVLDADAIEIDKQLKACEEKIDSITQVSNGILEKKFQINKIEQDAVKDEITRRSEVEKDIVGLQHQVRRLQDDITTLTANIKDDREIANDYKGMTEKFMQALHRIESLKFDESTAVCPTCGQKLTKQGVENARADFEKNNARQIGSYKQAVESHKKKFNDAVARIKDNMNKGKAKSNELKALQNSLAELEQIRADMGEVPEPDFSDNTEYQDLVENIANDEILIASLDDVKSEFNSLMNVKNAIDTEKRDHQRELDKLEQNKGIDEKIAELRTLQTVYEQSKADCEMILDQLKTLNMKKNEMLQESVNKNFNLINWMLFDFHKNGEVFDTCIPMIGDKVFGSSMNTALEIRAKIDAMNGIQKFFGFDYPILIDDCEHLDSESMKLIESDHQLIMMAVSNDEGMVMVND